MCGQFLRNPLNNFFNPYKKEEKSAAVRGTSPIGTPIFESSSTSHSSSSKTSIWLEVSSTLLASAPSSDIKCQYHRTIIISNSPFVGGWVSIVAGATGSSPPKPEYKYTTFGYVLRLV